MYGKWADSEYTDIDEPWILVTTSWGSGCPAHKTFVNWILKAEQNEALKIVDINMLITWDQWRNITLRTNHQICGTQAFCHIYIYQSTCVCIITVSVSLSQTEAPFGQNQQAKSVKKEAKACLSFILCLCFLSILKSFNNPNHLNVYITTNNALDCNLPPPSSLISPSSVILFDMDIM